LAELHFLKRKIFSFFDDTKNGPTIVTYCYHYVITLTLAAIKNINQKL